MNTPRCAQREHRSGAPRLPASLLAADRAFALLGRGWNALIIAALAKGPADFSQVRDRIPGISDRMLAERLRELATVGLVARTVPPGPPSRTLYALSPHGDAFLIPLASVIVWAEDHFPATGAPASD
ncbi:helix-turn-helix domain-containing protein [Streptomyces sp. ME18-1-4]|uniref:winged helix-turn-helix transcriptional regulator n=1 Tax=Streptomyces sp. ME18-1-4 TaxID=3028685 RepID=UPI0029B8038A|nr:helix-turn-helix domain-containing protein [Streptomyces sp. ME18-1-4]MDX3243217.1 helix-turn-helix domain-containing protein [Streptomyces sp. ME18-1-4]